MKCETNIIRSGYNFKKCLVHARCAYSPDMMIATAQYLDVTKCDVFESILLSISEDDGKTWSEFKYQEGLASIFGPDRETVACDATPMYHKKTGKFLLLGATTQYGIQDKNIIDVRIQNTFYSVFDEEKREFKKLKFVDMPEYFGNSTNGCGQSVELENGDLLIPINVWDWTVCRAFSTVMQCSFDGEEVKFIKMGSKVAIDIARGAYEPSLAYHNGMYYMTIRNDDCALVAKSKDGLNYEDMQLWKWEDGSILQSYNTQQHFAKVDDKLCLVYTRRNGTNDHVARHRAPLYMAQINDDLRLVKDSEIVVAPERGARLGNFGATEYKDGKAIVTAAEWMQPRGCEKYGSDNAIYISFVEA